MTMKQFITFMSVGGTCIFSFLTLTSLLIFFSISTYCYFKKIFYNIDNIELIEFKQRTLKFYIFSTDMMMVSAVIWQLTTI